MELGNILRICTQVNTMPSLNQASGESCKQSCHTHSFLIRLTLKQHGFELCESFIPGFFSQVNTTLLHSPGAVC